jgi:hypothetical protein
MDSTMRTRLLRVHDLAGRALFFLGAWACALHASAQVRCEARNDAALAPLHHRVWVTTQAGGDLLRYDTPGRSCELQLDGHISAWAVSAPGQPTVIAAATVAPAALVFLDTNLRELQRLQLKDRTGQQRSPICTLLVSQQRQSFVAIFSDMAELWELSYNPLAAEIGLGMVHDFQYREGHFVAGYLNPLRTALPWNVAGAGLDAEGHMVQLRKRASAQGGDTLVIHLDVRKPVRETVQLQGPLQACEIPDLLQK